MTVITNPCQESRLHEIATQFRVASSLIRIPNVENGESYMFDGARLYDNESDSDITFVAGLGGDTWRFPGHRSILAAASPVFRAMLTGPLAPPGPRAVIPINDVDKRAFEQLLRHLYGKPVTLPSVATARATLEVAHKYICKDLVWQCVVYLDLHLTPYSVLEVFQDLRFFCSRTPSTGTAPSAPPLQQNGGVEVAMTEMCDSLLHNCLIYIDENVDEVLRQEIFEELNFEDIAIIAARDTLQITCETELFNALNRWCVSECKRGKKELTSANRRQVLGELSYSVRYLLMTEKQFLMGPKASELLDLTECDLILRCMKGDRSVKFTPEQDALLKKFASPRLTTNNVKAIHLSDRSIPKKTPVAENHINDKIDSKKTKKQKKKEARALKKKLDDDEDEKTGCCNCSCFGQGLLGAFVFIFD